MDVFFYGLFMDEDILLKNGIHASNLRKGYINNYTLKIGNRASLMPYDGEKAYGIVMTVNAKDIVSLYAEKSVADYLPEELQAITHVNDVLKVTCYNLPKNLLSGTNRKYAQSLYDLAVKLDFPEQYVNLIKTYINT